AADGFIEKQFGKPARRQPGEGAALGKTSKRQAAIAFDAMPADLCGLKPCTGHRFDRVTKYGTEVTEFNSHGAILERCEFFSLERSEKMGTGTASCRASPHFSQRSYGVGPSFYHASMSRRSRSWMTSSGEFSRSSR